MWVDPTNRPNSKRIYSCLLALVERFSKGVQRVGRANLNTWGQFLRLAVLWPFNGQEWVQLGVNERKSFTLKHAQQVNGNELKPPPSDYS